MTEPGYSSAELMIINAARLLKDGDVVLVGVGQPNLACNLARRTHAPNLVMIYEAGVIGAQPARLPLSIGDPTLVSGATAVCSMYDLFSLHLQVLPVIVWQMITWHPYQVNEAISKLSISCVGWKGLCDQGLGVRI